MIAPLSTLLFAAGLLVTAALAPFAIEMAAYPPLFFLLAVPVVLYRSAWYPRAALLVPVVLAKSAW